MNIKNVGFMAGGGEMGERIQTLNWSNTAVGPMESWPQSLRTTLSILLHSKFPMFLFWGPELLCFYNDAYRPSLGNGGKHPDALGKPGEEVWPEAWSFIKPLIDRVLSGGEATWHEDQLVPIYRNGKLEDVYWTFSYSPVMDESGNVGGVLVTCNETTEKVVNLKHQHNYLQSAIDIGDLGTFKLDVATNLGNYSERVRDWFEVDTLSQPMEVISATVHPDDRQMVLQSIADSLKSEEQSRHDFSYRIVSAKDGSIRHLRSIGKAIFKGGTPDSIVGIIQDITTDVLARKQLEESESRFRNMIEQAPVAIALTRGRDHFIENMNTPMLRIVGRNREEAVGKNLTEAMPEIKDELVLKTLNNVLETGEAFTGNEVPIAYRPQEKLDQQYFNLSYTPLFEEGKVTGIIHAAVDVTEQVETRKKIEDSERQLRLITNALPVLIGYLDKEEKYRFANQAFKAWFNKEPEALLGRPVREVVGDKAYGGLKQYIDRALAGERLDFEARMPYRENFTKYIRTSYVPDVQNGEVAGFFTLVNDITEQVEIRQQLEEREKEAQAMAEELAASNEELRSSNDQVQETNEMLTSSNQKLSHINADMDSFIYTASHDLRAPISNIEGLMNAIQRNLPPESRQNPMNEKLFGMVTDSIERFKRTIRNLTEITKIEREITEDDAKVDLAQIIKEIQLDLSHQIEQAEATFDLHLQECVPINFSTKNVRSIVYNLISNAVKYRSPNRPLLVKIICYQQGEFLVLHMQDNGLGMDLTDKSKIFAMFKRLHDHVEGSGVGLYIVKKIIENAGGKIEVESKVDEGTTFRVYFRQTESS